MDRYVGSGRLNRVLFGIASFRARPLGSATGATPAPPEELFFFFRPKRSYNSFFNFVILFHFMNPLKYNPYKNLIGKTISDVKYFGSWVEIECEDGTSGYIDIDQPPEVRGKCFLGGSVKIPFHNALVSGGACPRWLD